jgi:hypothetical protein
MALKRLPVSDFLNWNRTQIFVYTGFYYSFQSNILINLQFHLYAKLHYSTVQIPLLKD